MGADCSVRDAAGHPHDALVHVDPVTDVHPLADEFHYPGLVFIGDGESLSLRRVAVGVGKVHYDVNGFTGRFCPLEGDVDKGTVVYPSLLVLKFRAAAPGGFCNDDLVLVHVAHGLEGMGNLLYVSKIAVGIPVVDLEDAAGFPVCGGLIVELSKQVMGVCGI